MEHTDIPFFVDPKTAPKLSQMPGLVVFLMTDP
jgi:hypothetical protein